MKTPAFLAIVALLAASLTVAPGDAEAARPMCAGPVVLFGGEHPCDGLVCFGYDYGYWQTCFPDDIIVCVREPCP